MRNKIIVQYAVWLIIALCIGIGVVWIETELFLKDIHFFTGFVVGVFKGLKKLLVLYLGSFIGVLIFLFFVPIHIKIIKKKIGVKRKQKIISFGTMVALAIALKVMHSILVYKFNLI